MTESSDLNAQILREAFSIEGRLRGENVEPYWLVAGKKGASTLRFRRYEVGQAWTGLFRDSDGNGVMEFSDADSRLPPGVWSREINFLSWQPLGGKAVRDLPAGAHLRITLQWREPHDCLPLKAGEDVYREPLAKLKLVLVRQPDPDGKIRPADDLDVVAQSASLPQRLNQTLNSAYTVPAGKTAYVQQISASLNRGTGVGVPTNREADICLYSRTFSGVFRTRRPSAISRLASSTRASGYSGLSSSAARSIASVSPASTRSLRARARL